MATNPSAHPHALDPMMGQLEVVEPGLAMFHGFANVAFAYGRGDMIAVDTSSRQMGEMAVAAIRKITDEPITLIVFYFALISTVLSALPLAVAWTAPDRALWGVLVAMGLLATAGQLFLTRAYAHARAAQVGPFIYSSVVFAAAFDWLVWGKLPDALSAAGSLLVVTAGVLTLRAAPAAAARVVPAD